MLIHQVCRAECAHRLPKHPGKCRNLHGHTYRIEVKIYFNDNTPAQESGVIYDFGDIKKIVDQFDHTYLNDHEKFTPKYLPPSAENFARLIADLIYEQLTETKTSVNNRKLSTYLGTLEVTVREGGGEHWAAIKLKGEVFKRESV